MTGTGRMTVETLQRLVDAFNAHDLDKDSYWKLVER